MAELAYAHDSKSCGLYVRVGSTPTMPTRMPKRKSYERKFIWTPELAYVVGLLVTDGNLSSDGRHIVMRSSDIDLLQTFKKCLKIDNKIGRTRSGANDSYRVQLGDVEFYRWLLTIGLFPNKTHSISAIRIPDEYFRDFIRGHFDGDGTLFTYKDKYNSYRGRVYSNNRVYVKLISVSPAHIFWLHRKIQKLSGLKGALIKNAPLREDRVPMWEVKLAKKESIKFLLWIYYKPNLPSLRRKQILARKLIKLVQNEKRKIYSKIRPD